MNQSNPQFRICAFSINHPNIHTNNKRPICLPESLMLFPRSPLFATNLDTLSPEDLPSLYTPLMAMRSLPTSQTNPRAQQQQFYFANLSEEAKHNLKSAISRIHYSPIHIPDRPLQYESGLLRPKMGPRSCVISSTVFQQWHYTQR